MGRGWIDRRDAPTVRLSRGLSKRSPDADGTGSVPRRTLRIRSLTSMMKVSLFSGDEGLG